MWEMNHSGSFKKLRKERTQKEVIGKVRQTCEQCWGRLASLSEPSCEGQDVCGKQR